LPQASHGSSELSSLSIVLSPVSCSALNQNLEDMGKFRGAHQQKRISIVTFDGPFGLQSVPQVIWGGAESPSSDEESEPEGETEVRTDSLVSDISGAPLLDSVQFLEQDAEGLFSCGQVLAQQDKDKDDAKFLDFDSNSGSSTPTKAPSTSNDSSGSTLDLESVLSSLGSTFGKDDDLGSFADLLQEVPKDEQGYDTSVGSIGHEIGLCGKPCVFMNRDSGCRQGVSCTFCHFSHGRKRHKPKQSSEKQVQRLRLRSVKARLMKALERSPATFNIQETMEYQQVEASLRDDEVIELVAVLERRKEELCLLKTIQEWEQLQAGIA